MEIARPSFPLVLLVRYDHEAKQTGSWQCFLAHDDSSSRLFSCGRGGESGDVRKWPHALVAKGVGEP